MRSFETEIKIPVTIEYEYTPGTKPVHDANDGWMPGDPSEVTNVKVLLQFDKLPAVHTIAIGERQIHNVDILSALDPDAREEVTQCCYEDAEGE